MISAWESRGVIPDTNTLPLIAAVLDCGISDFFSVSPVAEAEADTGDTATAGAA
jgi:hypothetical protein